MRAPTHALPWLGGAVLALLAACLPELVLLPCYSNADCSPDDTCQAGVCAPGSDVMSTCTVEEPTLVRTVEHSYDNDWVPPAALAFDGTRYWAIVEDIVPSQGSRYELYAVELDARGDRVRTQTMNSDPVVRGRSTGFPVGPFLERGPNGLVVGWNEKATEPEQYIGYAGPLSATGLVTGPRAFAGRLEALVLDGAETFAPIAIDAEGAWGLQRLGTSTVARFDPGLTTISAARAPTGEWLVVGLRGDSLEIQRLSSELILRGMRQLIDGSGGNVASRPRARWTGDALTVVFIRSTPTGVVVQLVETSTGTSMGTPQTLTPTITDDVMPAWTYSPARDEVAVAYLRGRTVEVVRRSRRTGATVVHTLTTSAVEGVEPMVVDAGGEYAAAWLEPNINGGNLLQMSRIVCR